MAKGKPSKWIEVKIKEPFNIGKRGINVTVWEKYGRRPLGHAEIRIGGIRWTPYMQHKGGRKSITVKWDRLAEL